METFILQTFNGEIQHEFAFHLKEAIKYQNWFRNENIYEYIMQDAAGETKGIPVGSLEFVFEYMEKHLGCKRETIMPINVPQELRVEKYLKRNYEIKNKEEILLTEPTFIKSATQYKGLTDVIEKSKDIPPGAYIVSENIEIESEWRTFVYQGKLVGLQHYLGDFTLFPDVSLINEMIEEYKSAPTAYTLDVGVNGEGTFVIEVHPFVSCGLYGFHDYRILPQMFIEGYKYMIKQAKESQENG